MRFKDLSDLRKAVALELDEPHPGRVNHAYWQGVINMIDCAILLASSIDTSSADHLFDRLTSGLEYENLHTGEFSSHQETYIAKQKHEST